MLIGKKCLIHYSKSFLIRLTGVQELTLWSQTLDDWGKVVRVPDGTTYPPPVPHCSCTVLGVHVTLVVKSIGNFTRKDFVCNNQDCFFLCRWKTSDTLALWIRKVTGQGWYVWFLSFFDLSRKWETKTRLRSIRFLRSTESPRGTVSLWFLLLYNGITHPLGWIVAPSCNKVLYLQTKTGVGKETVHDYVRLGRFPRSVPPSVSVPVPCGVHWSTNRSMGLLGGWENVVVFIRHFVTKVPRWT